MRIPTIVAFLAILGFFAASGPAESKPKQLEIYISKENVNLETRTLTFKLNRKADKAETTFYDPEGNIIELQSW